MSVGLSLGFEFLVFLVVGFRSCRWGGGEGGVEEAGDYDSVTRGVEKP